MELKVGGVYKTRDGKKAWVLDSRKGVQGELIFVGVAEGGGYFANRMWRPDGTNYGISDTKDSLISEWTEPRTQEVYVYEQNGTRFIQTTSPGTILQSGSWHLIKTITINLEDEDQ